MWTSVLESKLEEENKQLKKKTKKLTSSYYKRTISRWWDFPYFIVDAHVVKQVSSRNAFPGTHILECQAEYGQEARFPLLNLCSYL